MSIDGVDIHVLHDMFSQTKVSKVGGKDLGCTHKALDFVLRVQFFFVQVQGIKIQCVRRG